MESLCEDSGSVICSSDRNQKSNIFAVQTPHPQPHSPKRGEGSKSINLGDDEASGCQLEPRRLVAGNFLAYELTSGSWLI